MFNIDHLGIAVKSIAQARKFYEQLGMHVVSEEEIEDEKVRAAMLPVGDTRFELLEGTTDDSPISKFINKRGEGLHHVAVHVNDISATFEELKRRGVRLISDEIKVGAGGHLYIFVHPSATGGVLLELCQDPISAV
ncbi:MAG: methylmalonyl-CoA epimerase [Acidobacteria bacterium]|nr:methylmalonyl-CoA epimerase [Acidobacteriota bacterium]MBV9146007.1 methylmalonyl-CoA epimerase [Acidobacteriota bacterium]MBV9435716.1 methylmalonyl-CoA epimerase [Acidobacteriota bacterium]